MIIPGTRFNKNHDKLFFYAAYEYMDQHPAGSLHQYFVPTTEMLNGNFTPAYLSSLGTTFMNSETLDSASLNTAIYPSGQIPATDLNASSLAMLKLMPKPNINPATNPTGANYQTFIGPPVNRWELRLRGDYKISTNTKLFFSWNHQLEHDQNPISIWWQLNGSLPYPASQNANQDSNTYSANLVPRVQPHADQRVRLRGRHFPQPHPVGQSRRGKPKQNRILHDRIVQQSVLADDAEYLWLGKSEPGRGRFRYLSYGEPFTPPEPIPLANFRKPRRSATT
ncbi:MAG: hypothetical protein WDO73_27375 [Ignavibacteriota bacterium]